MDMRTSLSERRRIRISPNRPTPRRPSAIPLPRMGERESDGVLPKRPPRLRWRAFDEGYLAALTCTSMNSPGMARHAPCFTLQYFVFFPRHTPIGSALDDGWHSHPEG